MTGDIFNAAGFLSVKVSAASLRQLFHPCTPQFIAERCKARCCERSSGGIMVTLHPSEISKFRARGARVAGVFIQPAANGKCPFKTDANLCSTHADKPFGCAVSPFTLSPSGEVLVIRNRYRLLSCYRAEGALPAYKAHAWSLQQIFGAQEAARIAAHLDAGGGDMIAEMPEGRADMLRDNDAAKKRAYV